MLTFLLALAAFAQDAPPAPGLLVLDARLPMELTVDGQPLAQLYKAGEVRLELPAGTRRIRVYTNGLPNDLDVVVPTGGEVHLMAGRSGLSVSTAALAAPVEVLADARIPVQLRMADSIGARVHVDQQRIAVGAEAQVDLLLAPGKHAVSVRSDDGTVVWASGTLTVSGPGTVVMQLSEGRMPEVSGKGSFSTGP